MNKNLIAIKGENKEMPALFDDLFRHLFQIKFGEETSMCAFDFERSFHNYFNHDRKSISRDHFINISTMKENKFSKDFKRFIKKFFFE